MELVHKGSGCGELVSNPLACVDLGTGPLVPGSSPSDGEYAESAGEWAAVDECDLQAMLEQGLEIVEVEAGLKKAFKVTLMGPCFSDVSHRHKGLSLHTANLNST